MRKTPLNSKKIIYRSIGISCVLILFCVVLTSARIWVSGGKPKTFPIQIKVDFGSAGKPFHEETLYVETGTTPKEAVSQVFPVLSGKACCSLREVIEIGGVKIDPAKNRWWVCLVNGSKKISPHKKKLKQGDVVEWNYIQESQ